MRITAEQLVTLTMNVRLHRLHSGRQLYDAQEIRDILLSDHPDMDGVLPPPTYDQVMYNYLPATWGRQQMRAPYHPQRASVRPLTDETLRPTAPGPRWEAGSSRDALAPFQPPPDPVRQILSDLDVLRGDPMAALTYVCHRARGIESGEAMRWARLTANVHSLLQIAPGYIRADQRASSARGAGGSLSDARHQAAHQAWAPDPVVHAAPLSAIPGVDPLQVRTALERLGQPVGAALR